MTVVTLTGIIDTVHLYVFLIYSLYVSLTVIKGEGAPSGANPDRLYKEGAKFPNPAMFTPRTSTEWHKNHPEWVKLTGLLKEVFEWQRAEVCLYSLTCLLSSHFLDSLNAFFPTLLKFSNSGLTFCLGTISPLCILLVVLF